MPHFEDLILNAISRRTYSPVKPKALARQLGISNVHYPSFRRALNELHRQGRVEFGKNHTIRQAGPHGTATGLFRKAAAGFGFVRPQGNEGTAGAEIYIPEGKSLDASSGDVVLVRIRKKPSRPDQGPTGEVVQVIERATRQFVGTYFERDGQGYVRVDGTVFSHSIFVGDPGAKGARPEDKVVIEMLRFPGPNDRGEAVITEVLGPRGKPGVDTQSVIRAFGLPDAFPEDALQEARDAAAAFQEKDLQGREDFTKRLTITIDPVDARDFDDAVSLTRDPETGHWQLAVHIADVGHFAPPGGALDREARKRATSVYLPQRVIPMFPEVISNSLASLQQGKVRYVKSVLLEFDPDGAVVHSRFAEGAIRNRRRFTYEEVMEFLEKHPEPGIAHREPGPGRKSKPKREAPAEKRGSKKKSGSEGAVVQHIPGSVLAAEAPLPSPVEIEAVVHQGTGADSGRRRKKVAHPREIEPDIAAMLLEMRTLAMILRGRRLRKGALELEMPEAQLEYDENGKVTGAHFRTHDVSHQIIEEFMLAANEAVAMRLGNLGVAFLRRIHPPPVENKLRAFAEFAHILGYKIKNATDRFALQRVLQQSAVNPDRAAVHYALLRSLKQAVYSPLEEGHYALAIEDYCHFTSPIRRYPDLVVHRLLGRWLRTGRAGSDETELAALGDHCSKMERRADLAERELVKVKLLDYMSERIGARLEVVITGVADYGFWAQAENLPVEGLVHIDTLADDFYYYDEASHSLSGRRTKRRYRLGDRVLAQVVRVDLNRRQLDFRIVDGKKK
jgi:ribonuclease R